MRTLAIFLVLCTLLATACEEQALIFPKGSSESRLAVIATLADSVHMEVLISNAVPFNTNAYLHEVPDAEVQLFKNGNFEARLVHVDNDRNCSGNCGFGFSRYLSEQTLFVEEGANYHLEVRASGYPEVRSEVATAERQLNEVVLDAVISDTTIYFNGPDKEPSHQIKIDSFTLQYDFRGNRSDDLLLELYRGHRIDQSPIAFWFPNPEQEIALSTQSSVPQSYSYPAFDRIFLDKKNPGLTLDLVRYPAGYVEFRDMIQKRNTGSVASIYDTSPTPIPTNMIGGYGYFTILEHYQIYYAIE